MKTKQQLRSHLKVERAAMPLSEVVEKSARITVGVQAILDKLDFYSLHCYEPIVKLHEVDVSEILDTPDVAIYTSRKQEGEWQVVSVIDDRAKPDIRLDVIIVPMLGFDDHLHRLGYGGGYYDRLLANHPNALRIGVCYESGHIDRLPAELHDMPLAIIVTEDRVLIAASN